MRGCCISSYRVAVQFYGFKVISDRKQRNLMYIIASLCQSLEHYTVSGDSFVRKAMTLKLPGLRMKGHVALNVTLESSMSMKTARFASSGKVRQNHPPVTWLPDNELFHE